MPHRKYDHLKKSKKVETAKLLKYLAGGGVCVPLNSLLFMFFTSPRHSWIYGHLCSVKIWLCVEKGTGHSVPKPFRTLPFRTQVFPYLGLSVPRPLHTQVSPYPALKQGLLLVKRGGKGEALCWWLRWEVNLKALLLSYASWI